MLLLGRNFANILASSVATLIGMRLLGDAGIAVAAILLTIVIAIFGAVAPKTLAALKPERIALPASYVLEALLRALHPLVWLLRHHQQLVARDGRFARPGIPSTMP